MNAEAMPPAESPAFWQMYVTVDDVAASVAQVTTPGVCPDAR